MKNKQKKVVIPETLDMSYYFFKKAEMERRHFTLPPSVVITVPSSLTGEEKKAIAETVTKAGARAVYLVPKPVAIAVGTGLPIKGTKGYAIIDIGGGTTDMAVIAFGGIVVMRSIRIAGKEMDEAISEYLKKKYNLLIEEQVAEKIKINVGSVFPLEEELTIKVNGRDLIEKWPKTITIHSEEIRDALKEISAIIVGEVQALLEDTPPELVNDIIKQGIRITGGTSLLRGFDKLLAQETKIPVHACREPFYTAIRGIGKILEGNEEFSTILSTKNNYMQLML